MDLNIPILAYELFCTLSELVKITGEMLQNITLLTPQVIIIGNLWLIIVLFLSLWFFFFCFCFFVFCFFVFTFVFPWKNKLFWISVD